MLPVQRIGNQPGVDGAGELALQGRGVLRRAGGVRQIFVVQVEQVVGVGRVVAARVAGHLPVVGFVAFITLFQLLLVDAGQLVECGFHPIIRGLELFRRQGQVLSVLGHQGIFLRLGVGPRSGSGRVGAAPVHAGVAVAGEGHGHAAIGRGIGRAAGLAAGAPVVLQRPVAPLAQKVGAGHAQRGGVVEVPFGPGARGRGVKRQQVGRGRSPGQGAGGAAWRARGEFCGPGLTLLLGGQSVGRQLVGNQLGVGVLGEALGQDLLGQAGQGLQAVLRFDNGVLLSELLEDVAPLLDGDVGFGFFRQVLHRAVVVRRRKAVFLQVLVVNTAREEVGVALLQPVGGGGPNGLPQQLQRLGIVLFAVVQPRHLVVNLVAVVLVLGVFQQGCEVLVQPRPVGRVQVRHLAEHQLGLKIQLVRRVAGQNLVELLVGFLVLARVLVQLGQHVARPRPLVLELNQRNGLLELRDGPSRLIGPNVVVGAGQKQLAGILWQAGFLVEQVRYRPGTLHFALHHKGAHQANQGFVLGVGVFAGRVYVLKRQRRVVELHLVEPRPAHQHVSIVGPVGARPVLNRHRRLFDDVVHVGPAGPHGAAVQGRKQGQRLVVVVHAGRVELVLGDVQLLAGQKVGVVPCRHVVERVRHQVFVRRAARRAQPQQAGQQRGPAVYEQMLCQNHRRGKSHLEQPERPQRPEMFGNGAN